MRAGGNHVVACTAGGLTFGNDRQLKLRERDLAPVLKEFLSLPESQRRPDIEDPAAAKPAQRPVPDPPVGGLIIRGYCTYLRTDEAGDVVRAKEYYYKENPDRWAAETQSDMLWLTADEWKSFIPADPKVGDQIEVAQRIQTRFFSTIGIDYMEGSVNSLPPRDTTMTLTVEKVSPAKIELRLDGYGRLGKEYDEKAKTESHSRGCEVRVIGVVHYDRKAQKIDRFDIVGIGEAWGNKMNYVHREVRLPRDRWLYGIACELVTGDSPTDLIPPYNLLHYNSVGPYFTAQ